MNLCFPPFEYRVRVHDGQRQIFDILRKKYVCLTPEEWVRQHVIHFLINEKGYSPSLMAVERAFTLNGLVRRFDLVCFDRSGDIFMVVECKNSRVKLSNEVFDQVFCYNTELRASYVAVTNGLEVIAGRFGERGAEIMDTFPEF